MRDDFALFFVYFHAYITAGGLDLKVSVVKHRRRPLSQIALLHHRDILMKKFTVLVTEISPVDGKKLTCEYRKCIFKDIRHAQF